MGFLRDVFAGSKTVDGVHSLYALSVQPDENQNPKEHNIGALPDVFGEPLEIDGRHYLRALPLDDGDLPAAPRADTAQTQTAEMSSVAKRMADDSSAAREKYMTPGDRAAEYERQVRAEAEAELSEIYGEEWTGMSQEDKDAEWEHAKHMYL